jgi:hypothetical protein
MKGKVTPGIGCGGGIYGAPWQEAEGGYNGDRVNVGTDGKKGGVQEVGDEGGCTAGNALAKQ